MNIALDGLLLFPPFTGLQTTLVKHIESISGDEDTHLTVFVPNDLPDTPAFSSNVHIVRTRFNGAKRVRRTLYRNFFMVRECYRQDADILHGACYYLPMGSSLPSVVTIHDLIALTHRDLVSKGSYRLFKRTLPKTLKRAGRVIVPTMHVKEQLVGLMKTDPAVIDVIPWYVDVDSQPTRSRAETAAKKKKMNLPDRYILFVGRLEKKKNLPLLIKAFWAARMAEPSISHTLLICGPPGNALKEIHAAIQSHNAEKMVALTGYLPQHVLDDVYRLADAVVLPSVTEGFGLPVLESFAHGTPVLCSDIPPLRDVGANAAIYAAPDSVRQWREILTRACVEPAVLKEKVDAGYRRAGEFSRSRYAAAVSETYRRTLADCRR